MTDLRTAAQQALDDLRDLHANHNITYAGTISRLEAALAQQDEPVEKPEGEQPAGVVVGFTDEGRAIVDHDGLEEGWVLYTTPPQQAEPLTEEDIKRIFMTYQSPRQAARAVERAHGITDPQIEDRLARHGIPMPGDPK